MHEDAPVTRSSLVPVLGAIALMLFSLNFYTFLDRHFSDDVRQFFCDREPILLKHDRSPHVTFHHDAWKQRDLEREMRQAERALRHAQRFMGRDLDRAERELARAQREMERALRDLERAGASNNEHVTIKLQEALREIERAQQVHKHTLDLNLNQLRELRSLQELQDHSDVHDAHSIILKQGDHEVVIRTQ